MYRNLASSTLPPDQGNRTYDQVFGDIERGRRDPSLVMYGREVTPNHHALAEEFVLSTTSTPAAPSASKATSG